MDKVVLRQGREPFEVFYLVACLISGGFGVLGLGGSPNLTLAFGPYVVWWHAGILLGAVLALGSLVARWPSPGGLGFERTGMILLAGLLGAYGAAIFLTGGPNTGGLLIVIAFGVAPAVRAWQITADLRVLKRALAELEREL